MEKRKTYFVVTVLFLLYIAAVLCLCLLNLSETVQEMPKYFLGIPMDKLAHFLMFFAYPLLCWLMLTYNKRIRINRKYLFSTIFISGLTFAAFTETAQGLFTIYREPDNIDFIADAIGIVSCTIAIWVLQSPLKRAFDRLQEYFHELL